MTSPCCAHSAASASASEAQARVNAAMQQALAQAHKIDGLMISTGGYGVWRTGPTSADRNERWQVSQTLSLTGLDGSSRIFALAGLVVLASLALQGPVMARLVPRVAAAGPEL